MRAHAGSAGEPRPKPVVGLIHILARTAGAAAATRAIPLFGGMGIVTSVLFSPNGMRARDVTALAAEVFVIRAALWAAWIVAVVPLARSLFCAPGTSFLRSLPVSRYGIAAILWSFLFALQAPWALLWGMGAGPMWGACAALGAAAIEAQIVAGPRRAWEWIALVGFSLLAISSPWPVLIGVIALPLSALFVWAAWVRAPEGTARGFSMVRGPMPVALSLSYHVRLLRAEQGVILRGFAVALVSGLMAALGAKNTGRMEPEPFCSFTLAVSSVFLTVGAGGVAGPVFAAERELIWLLDTTGTRRLIRVASARAAVASWGAVFGVTLGLVASSVVGVGAVASLRVIGFEALWGAAIGVLAGEAVARTARRGVIGGGRLVASLVALGLGALLGAAFFGERAALALFVFALLCPCLPRGRERG